MGHHMVAAMIFSTRHDEERRDCMMQDPCERISTCSTCERSL